MCSASRYVLIAWFAGLVTTSLTGSDVLGWAAAGIAVAAAYGLARWSPARFGGGSCALPQRPAAELDAVAPRPADLETTPDR